MGITGGFLPSNVSFGAGGGGQEGPEHRVHIESWPTQVRQSSHPRLRELAKRSCLGVSQLVLSNKPTQPSYLVMIPRVGEHRRGSAGRFFCWSLQGHSCRGRRSGLAGRAGRGQAFLPQAACHWASQCLRSPVLLSCLGLSSWQCAGPKRGSCRVSRGRGLELPPLPRHHTPLARASHKAKSRCRGWGNRLQSLMRETARSHHTQDQRSWASFQGAYSTWEGKEASCSKKYCYWVLKVK